MNLDEAKKVANICSAAMYGRCQYCKPSVWNLLVRDFPNIKWVQLEDGDIIVKHATPPKPQS